MTDKAAITVNRRRDDVERLWRGGKRLEGVEAMVGFSDAPGNRGTEIHVTIQNAPGRLAVAVQKVRGDEPVAKVKDELRRFKQEVETGVIARSDSTPEAELLERKSSQRPAQPVEA